MRAKIGSYRNKCHNPTLKSYCLYSKRRQLRRKVAETIQSANGVSLSPIEVIRKVNGLAAEVGGLKKLQQLVEVLSD